MLINLSDVLSEHHKTIDKTTSETTITTWKRKKN